MSSGSTSGPLVSVILPVRDRADCVARAIRSVLQQQYRNRELIVIDDGSRDGTVDVVTRFGDAVRLIRQAGGGVSAARNRGLAVARGDLVAFIDSDDFWYPNKLSRQIALFDDPGVALAFSDARHVVSPTANAQATGRTSFGVAPPPRHGSVAGFVASNFVPTSTVVARRAMLLGVGGFPAVPLAEDYPVWVDIGLQHDLAYIDACLVDYTVHAAGISHDLEHMLRARLDIFANKLRITRDAPADILFRRIAFNAAMSLLIASLRGKASRAAGASGVGASLRYGGPSTLSWLARFLLDRRRRGRWQHSNQACSIRRM